MKAQSDVFWLLLLSNPQNHRLFNYDHTVNNTFISWSHKCLTFLLDKRLKQFVFFLFNLLDCCSSTGSPNDERKSFTQHTHTNISILPAVCRHPVTTKCRLTFLFQVACLGFFPHSIEKNMLFKQPNETNCAAWMHPQIKNLFGTLDSLISKSLGLLVKCLKSVLWQSIHREFFTCWKRRLLARDWMRPQGSSILNGIMPKFKICAFISFSVRELNGGHI